jgi:hypothetical protein
MEKLHRTYLSSLLQRHTFYSAYSNINTEMAEDIQNEDSYYHWKMLGNDGLQSKLARINYV